MAVEIDFHFAIDVITDLAAILLECNVNGLVNIHDLDDYAILHLADIRIVATADEHAALNNVLKSLRRIRSAMIFMNWLMIKNYWNLRKM